MSLSRAGDKFLAFFVLVLVVGSFLLVYADDLEWRMFVFSSYPVVGFLMGGGGYVGRTGGSMFDTPPLKVWVGVRAYFPGRVKEAVNNYTGYAYWNQRGSNWTKINVTAKIKYMQYADQDIGWFGKAMLRLLSPQPNTTLRFMVIIDANDSYVNTIRNLTWVDENNVTHSEWIWMEDVNSTGQGYVNFNDSTTASEFYSHFTTLPDEVGRDRYFYFGDLSAVAYIGELPNRLVQVAQLAYFLFYRNLTYVTDKYLKSYVSVNGTNETGITVNTHYKCEAWDADGYCVDWEPVGEWVYNVTNVTWRYAYSWRLVKYEWSYWKPVFMIATGNKVYVVPLDSLRIRAVRVSVGLKYLGFVAYGGYGGSGYVFVDTSFSLPAKLKDARLKVINATKKLVFNVTLEDLYEPIYEYLHKKVGDVQWFSINPYNFVITSVVVTWDTIGRTNMVVSPSLYEFDPNYYAYFKWGKYLGRWCMGEANHNPFARVSKLVEVVFTRFMRLGAGVGDVRLLVDAGSWGLKWIPVVRSGLDDGGVHDPVNLVARVSAFGSLTVDIDYGFNESYLLNYGRVFGVYGYYLGGLKRYIEMINRLKWELVKVNYVSVTPYVLPAVHVTLYFGWLSHVSFVWWDSFGSRFSKDVRHLVLVGYDQVEWVAHYRRFIRRLPEARVLAFKPVQLRSNILEKLVKKLQVRRGELMAMPVNAWVGVWARYYFVNASSGETVAWGNAFTSFGLRYTFLFNPYDNLFAVWVRGAGVRDAYDELVRNETFMSLLAREGIHFVWFDGGVLYWKKLGIENRVLWANDTVHEYALLFQPGETFYGEYGGWVLPKFIWDRDSPMVSFWCDRYNESAMMDGVGLLYRDLIGGGLTGVDLRWVDEALVSRLVEGSFNESWNLTEWYRAFLGLNISSDLLKMFGVNGSVENGVLHLFVNGSIYNLTIAGSSEAVNVTWSIVNRLAEERVLEVVVDPLRYYGFVAIPYWNYYPAVANVTVSLKDNVYVVNGKELADYGSARFVRRAFPLLLAVVGDSEGNVTLTLSALDRFSPLRFASYSFAVSVGRIDYVNATVSAIPLSVYHVLGLPVSVFYGGEIYSFLLEDRFFDSPNLVVLRVLRGTYLLPRDYFRAVSYGSNLLEGRITLYSPDLDVFTRTWVRTYIKVGNVTIPAFCEAHVAMNATSLLPPIPGYSAPYLVDLRFPILPYSGLRDEEVYVFFQFVGGGGLLYDTGLTYGDFLGFRSVSGGSVVGGGGLRVVLLFAVAFLVFLYFVIRLLKGGSKEGGNVAQVQNSGSVSRGEG